MASELKQWPYQQTFNAIAAATKIEGGGIAISVKKFAEAFGPRPAPAATDTGLVRYDLSMFGNGIVEMGGGAYVRADQAVELLAAERSEKEQAKDDLTRVLVHFVREHFPENTTFKPLDDLIGLITQFDNASTIAREYASRIHALEADNASLIHDLNRIKDHETELVNDNAAKDARIKELRDTSKQMISNWRNRAEKAEAKLAAAEKALEPFALVAEHDIGEDETDSDAFRPMPKPFNHAPQITVGHLRAARAVLGGKP